MISSKNRFTVVNNRSFHLFIFLTCVMIGVGAVYLGQVPDRDTDSGDQYLHQSKNDELSRTGVGYGSGSGTATKVRTGLDAAVGTLSCRNSELRPLWELLLEDENFQFKIDGIRHDADCSDILRIRKKDLNGDGMDEIIVAGWNWALCSATRNCGVWIFEKKRGRFIKLLSDISHSETEPIPVWINHKTENGYKIVRLQNHLSGYETSFRELTFQRGKYVETKCEVQIVGFASSVRSMSCDEHRKQ
jgi:hypothetical protein